MFYRFKKRSSNKRKWLTIVLALAIVFTMMSAMVLAADTVTTEETSLTDGAEFKTCDEDGTEFIFTTIDNDGRYAAGLILV